MWHDWYLQYDVNYKIILISMTPPLSTCNKFISQYIYFYGIPLIIVLITKYLELFFYLMTGSRWNFTLKSQHKIAYNNSNFPKVYQNQKKLWRRWGVITSVLEKMVATMWACGMMYNAVAQSVLLYSSDSWVVEGAMLKVLEGFHHQASTRVTGITAERGSGG